MHAIQPRTGKLIASNWKTFSACPDLCPLLSSSLSHCQSPTLLRAVCAPSRFPTPWPSFSILFPRPHVLVIRSWRSLYVRCWDINCFLLSWRNLRNSGGRRAISGKSESYCNSSRIRSDEGQKQLFPFLFFYSCVDSIPYFPNLVGQKERIKSEFFTY